MKRFPDMIQNLNFSGKGGLTFYNSLVTQFSWTKRSTANTGEIAQVIFHSMFGTSAIRVKE